MLNVTLRFPVDINPGHVLNLIVHVWLPTDLLKGSSVHNYYSTVIVCININSFIYFSYSQNMGCVCVLFLDVNILIFSVTVRI